MKHGDELPELRSVAEVAATLKVSRSIVYQLVNNGRLAAHRIGIGRGAIRISDRDLQAFLASSREVVASDAPKPAMKMKRQNLRHLRG